MAAEVATLAEVDHELDHVQPTELDTRRKIFVAQGGPSVSSARPPPASHCSAFAFGLLHEVPTAATLAGGGLILIAVAAEVLAMDEAPA